MKITLIEICNPELLQKLQVLGSVLLLIHHGGSKCNTSLSISENRIATAQSTGI